MKENESIKQLFEDLFEGDPWIDINIIDTLNNITSKKAAIKSLQFPNSIWEIVNHLINWRLDVLKRVQGKVLQSPENNYFESIADTSQTAWQATIKRLIDSQTEWIQFLDKADPHLFSIVYPENKMSYFKHIHGIIQHDAYHLGQIVIIAKHTKQ